MPDLLSEVEKQAENNRLKARKEKGAKRDPVPDDVDKLRSNGSVSQGPEDPASFEPTRIPVPGVELQPGVPLIFAISLPADSSWVTENELPSVSNSPDNDLAFSDPTEASEVNLVPLWQKLNRRATLTEVAKKVFVRENDGQERARVYVKFQPGENRVVPPPTVSSCRGTSSASI